MGERVYHSQLSCLTPVKTGFSPHTASRQARKRTELTRAISEKQEHKP